MKNTCSLLLPTLMLGGILLLLAPLALAEPPKAAESAAPLNALTADEQKAGWQLLFDGKTTNGWRNYRAQGSSRGWKVIDGALTRAEENAGDVVTVGEYGSFELSLEYNISRGGNSGVMFHVTEDQRAPWMSGPEVQIVDNKEGGDPQLAGWLYALYSSEVDATRPPGQWNHFRIIVTPQKCETYVNGIKYYEYVIGGEYWDRCVSRSKFANFPKFGKATRGHIDLQDHGAWVAFRNIKIRPLSEK